MLGYLINVIFYFVFFTFIIFYMDSKYENISTDDTFNRMNWLTILLMSVVPSINFLFVVIVLLIIFVPDAYNKYSGMLRKFINRS